MLNMVNDDLDRPAILLDAYQGACFAGSYITVNLFSEIVLNNQRSIAFSKRDHAAADSAQSAARLHTDRPAIRVASYGLQRLHQP